MSETTAKGAKGDVTILEPSANEARLARRVAESRATVPDLVLQAEADVTNRGARLLDMFVLAAGRALREHPRANGAYRDARFESYERVNVGFVVDTADGPATATVFDADTKPLEQIAIETRTLGGRILDGTLTAAERSGATTTLHDLSDFNVLSFAPVLAPGQATAIGIGTMHDRPGIRNGDVVTRGIVVVTLVCDHRILHGSAAGAFLRSLVAHLGG